MKYCMLCYDIPMGSKFPNPSGDLRRFGFRKQYSTWIIPEHKVPWTLLDTWPAYVTRDVVRFDEGEEAKIRAMAFDAFNREATAIRDGMIASIAKAEAKIAELEAQSASPDTVAKQREKVKGVLYTARVYLKKAQEAAVAFDLLAEVTEAYDAVHKAITAEYAARFGDAYIGN